MRPVQSSFPRSRPTRPNAASADLPQPLQQPDQADTSYIGWSPKLQREVRVGSRLEYLHWMLVEGTPEVLHFCEYYPAVPLEAQEFVFDMWLRWKDGREVCREVLPAWAHTGTDTLPPGSPDWNVLESWAQEKGYTCEVMTERKLAGSMKFINNWRRMLPFVKYSDENLDSGLEREVRQRLRDTPDLSLRELTRNQSALRETQLTAAVAKLLHTGTVTADLAGTSFGPALMLRLASEALEAV